MDGIWAISMPMPVPTNPATFSYLVTDADGAPHLIDSGLESQECRTALEGGLAEHGFAFADIRSVTMTHLHRDHTGLAAAVRSAGGARLAMHRDEVATGLVTLPIDVLLDDGDRLDIPGRNLRVLHTPGHTIGHICIVSDEDRLVFTGDHLLPDQFPGIGLGGPSGGNPVVQYFESLGLLRELDGYTAMPGHGWSFDTIGERVDETLAHHGKRTAEVAAVLAANPGATAAEVAPQLTWSFGWENLDGMMRESALRQVAWHMELVSSR